MNIKYLKLLGLALPFFLLRQGCSFYAGLAAVKQPEQANTAANTEERGDISSPENGQVQAVLTNSP